MTSSSGDAKSSRGLTDADQALLQALSAWRGRSPAADDFVSRSWHRLDPSWAGRLREVWERGSTALGSDDPAAVLDRLRRTHAATAESISAGSTPVGGSARSRKNRRPFSGSLPRPLPRSSASRCAMGSYSTPKIWPFSGRSIPRS